MKTLRIFPILAILIAFSQISFAQSKSETIPVSGNCEMCKKTIEKAAKSGGATKAEWDVDAKILAVTYNSSSTNAAKIQQSIAAAGYDTRDVKANDKAYSKLPHCCQYDRAESAKAACCDNDKCGKSENGCAGMDCCKDGKCMKKTGTEPAHDHGALGETSVNQAKAGAMACCQEASCGKRS